MKLLYSLLIVLFFYNSAFAQYTTQGIIEYERKSNIHRQFDDMFDKEENNSWMTAMKARVPKYMMSYFNFYFMDGKSLYKPGREVDNPMKGMWGQAPASDNIVFTDFKTHKVKASKTVYDTKYLIEDTIKKINWKIDDEIRMISGYKCRKAVGKMFDSVVVVAFYTDDIMVNGGPEMFAGLPGLILEIAIPRMYTTWIATKIQLVQPKPEELIAPDKGKPTSQKDLMANLSKSTKDWGKSAQRILWWTFL